MNKIKLNITEPCHENWDKMQAQEQGRFCASCQKCVIDFSNYSDEALLKYFETPRVNTCGRLRNDQLDRLIVGYKPAGHHFYSRVMMGLAVFLSLFHSAEAANPKGVKSQKTNVHNTPAKKVHYYCLSGKITDTFSNKPIEDVAVKIKGHNIGAFTDTAGNFAIYIPDFLVMKKPVLQILKMGYNTKEIVLQGFKYPHKLEIELLVHPIQISGNAYCVASRPMMTMGGIGYTSGNFEKLERKATRWQRIKNFFRFKRKHKEQ